LVGLYENLGAPKTFTLAFWCVAPGLSRVRWNRRSQFDEAFSKAGFVDITTFAIVSPLRLTAETAK
jgi:hypothetical protein